jgi:cytochrome c2
MKGAGRAILLLACLATAGCDLMQAAELSDDAAKGRAIVVSGVYGCAACHAFPDIAMPSGVAGPPLEGIARRGLIAGQLPNKPEVLIAFLLDPASLVPDTGMPNVGMTLEEARQIADYLYTLEPSDAS